MFLLDTNVLSGTSPTGNNVRPEFIEWLDVNERLCFISVLTVMEISYGIRHLSHKGATKKAYLLSEWLKDIQNTFADRIIVCDMDTAESAGTLLIKARSRGIVASSEDALIAATGQKSGYTVITFNIKDFKPMGVSILHPDDALRDDALGFEHGICYTD